MIDYILRTIAIVRMVDYIRTGIFGMSRLYTYEEVFYTNGRLYTKR